MGSGVVYHGGKDLTEIQTQVIDLQTLSMFRNVGFKFDACLKRSKIYVSAGVSSTPFEHAPSYGRERGSNPPSPNVGFSVNYVSPRIVTVPYVLNINKKWKNNLRPYSKSSLTLTLNEWRFNLSFS